MNFKLIKKLWVDNLDINYLKKEASKGGFKLSELDKSDRRIRQFTSCQKANPPFPNLI
mgnify:CR=1 FL=1